MHIVPSHRETSIWALAAKLRLCPEPNHRVKGLGALCLISQHCQLAAERTNPPPSVATGIGNPVFNCSRPTFNLSYNYPSFFFGLVQFFHAVGKSIADSRSVIDFQEDSSPGALVQFTVCQNWTQVKTSGDSPKILICLDTQFSIGGNTLLGRLGSSSKRVSSVLLTSAHRQYCYLQADR